MIGEAAKPAMQAARNSEEVNIWRPALLYVHHLSADPPSVWLATSGKNSCRKLSMDVTPPVMPTSYPEQPQLWLSLEEFDALAGEQPQHAILSRGHSLVHSVCIAMVV